MAITCDSVGVACGCFLYSLCFDNVITFPNYPCYPYFRSRKIVVLFSNGGLGAKPPSYLIVSCRN